jgi:exonuclease SbcD
VVSLLHTADVHLRPDADERLDGLQAVLDLAADREVEALTIGGDLFDRPADVDELRTDLRNRYFSDLPFEVVLIPGNHDVDAFRGDLFFGDSCTVIADAEHFGTWRDPDDEVRVVGIPYQEEATDELLLALEERPAFDGTDVLLFHGSLQEPVDAPIGDEDAYRYFEIAPEVLAELGFDYYLAGHYHIQRLHQFETGAEFAYPGPPASTTSAETGPRQAVGLSPSEGLSFEPLDTFHYLETTVSVTPCEEAAALDELESWVDEVVTPAASPSITVTGVLDADETAFAERLQEIAEPGWLTNETIGVGEVRAHPVLEEFETRLAETDWDDDLREAVRARTLREASTALSEGDE